MQQSRCQHPRKGETKMSMFCHQCEQALKGIACEEIGVCGKNAEVAKLQDLMLYGLKGLAIYGTKARELGVRELNADRFMFEGLFSTVTNVDFDPVQLAAKLRTCYDLKEKVKSLYETAYREKNNGAHAPAITDGPAAWVIADDLAGLVKQGEAHGVKSQALDQDVLSAIEIVVYGL